MSLLNRKRLTALENELLVASGGRMEGIAGAGWRA